MHDLIEQPGSKDIYKVRSNPPPGQCSVVSVLVLTLSHPSLPPRPSAPTHAMHKHAHSDAAHLGLGFKGRRLQPRREHTLDRARSDRRRPRRDLRFLFQAARARPFRRGAPAHRPLPPAGRVGRHPVWVGRRARLW